MKRMRKILFSGLRPGLALAILLTTLPGCRPGRAAYDNLVLVTIDTLRADHLGLYGYPRPTSPYLDELGREGVVFWKAVTASSHTAPSHATLLTSLYPEQHRVLVNGQQLDPQVPALASLLQEGGAETAGFVSVRFLEGLKPGFDVFDAVVPEGEVFRTANLTVDRAIEWLRRREPGRRFALWVHVYDPHQHVVTTRMPEPYYRHMREDSARRGEELLYFLKQEQAYPHDELGGNIDRYDAQIAFVDAEIRRLFEAVAEAAPAERTLRVVTADHGEGLGNHGIEGHGQNLYQEQLRAPLILHGDPRAAAPRGGHESGAPRGRAADGGRAARRFTRAARICASRGSPSCPSWRSPTADLGIEPAFSQRRPPDERRLSIGWDPGVKLAAQDGRHKYIQNPGPLHEFYDLSRDPYEQRNLIHAESPEKERLREWLRQKHEALTQDHRSKSLSDEIDPQLLEDLKALGYLQ